jgi:UDP-N-acetylglucosamine 4-epimerase
MTKYDQVTSHLVTAPKTWLVTGVAGFIGSNLLETLLRLGQTVVGLDNFSTGSRENLEEVRGLVGPEKRENFRMIEGDTRDFDTCLATSEGVDCILHHAALGSVPRSLKDPLNSHANNVNGFLNILAAAQQHGIKRLVYASSSSVYGNHRGLPKVEDQIGECLSPYAATKRVNELYASVFAHCYGLEVIGLRYFNVFGPRQDPDGAYAAVIPKWTSALLKQEPIFINGDGETSRDFCFIANVVQANLLAAAVVDPEALNQVYNIAVHSRTTLNELFRLLRNFLSPFHPEVANSKPIYREFRSGDVRHSEADISKAKRFLGYRPTHSIEQGLNEALDWYREHLAVEKA